MSSPNVEADVVSVAKEEGASRLLISLAEGLHAMAQPLTILRGSVAAAAALDTDPVKQRRYLDLSAEQVQRMCTLFEHLQDLVIAHQSDGEHKAVDGNSDLGRSG